MVGIPNGTNAPACAIALQCYGLQNESQTFGRAFSMIKQWASL